MSYDMRHNEYQGNKVNNINTNNYLFSSGKIVNIHWDGYAEGFNCEVETGTLKSDDHLGRLLFKALGENWHTSDEEDLEDIENLIDDWKNSLKAA